MPYLLQPGDTIFATNDILNDGSFPDYEENELIVNQGTRGVIINFGHLEENEDQEIFLVKFETDTEDLGPPVGCWPQDIQIVADDINR